MDDEPNPVRANRTDDGYVMLRIHPDAVWFDPEAVDKLWLVRLTPEDAEELLTNLRLALSGRPPDPLADFWLEPGGTTE